MSTVTTSTNQIATIANSILGKPGYPHKFWSNDSKGNTLVFPDECPEDRENKGENRQSFPLVNNGPYNGGKNNDKYGDQRVIYYWTGETTYDGNPIVFFLWDDNASWEDS
jgi:hypothetical protein